MNEIFLDTETTGLSYRDGHKIVEIACIETKDLIPTGNIFHKFINPKRSMPSQAFNVHGFSEEFLKDKETFDQVADEFINFVKDKKIIIHNASFDLGFLDGELSFIKKDKMNKKLVIDSLEEARNKFPGTSNIKVKNYNKKITKISDIEIKKHKEFLKSELKKNFY